MIRDKFIVSDWDLDETNQASNFAEIDIWNSIFLRTNVIFFAKLVYQDSNARNKTNFF